MNKFSNSLALSLFISLFHLNIAYGEVYKWVDENGKVHYSDRKIDSSAKKLSISKGASTLGEGKNADSNARQEQRDRLLNSYEADRIERKEKRELEKQQKEQRNKYCTALKDQLRSFEEDHAIWYDLDEKSGERKYITDDDLQSRIGELRKEINSNCS